MSLENVEKFFARLGEDRTLRESISKAAEGLKDKFKTKEELEDKGLTEAYSVMEPFAKELELPFTLSDLKAYSTHKAKVLSDEQLNDVSGGLCMCVAAGAGTNADGSAAPAGCALFGMGYYNECTANGSLMRRLWCSVLGAPAAEIDSYLSHGCPATG